MKRTKRSLAVLKRPGPAGSGRFGLIRTTIGGRQDYYLVGRVRCEFDGSGWWLWRLGTDALYHVRVGAIPSCECLGFLTRGTCKHIESIRAAFVLPRVRP